MGAKRRERLTRGAHCGSTCSSRTTCTTTFCGVPPCAAFRRATGPPRTAGRADAPSPLSTQVSTQVSARAPACQGRRRPRARRAERPKPRPSTAIRAPWQPGTPAGRNAGEFPRTTRPRQSTGVRRQFMPRLFHCRHSGCGHRCARRPEIFVRGDGGLFPFGFECDLAVPVFRPAGGMLNSGGRPPQRSRHRVRTCRAVTRPPSASRSGCCSQPSCRRHGRGGLALAQSGVHGGRQQGRCQRVAEPRVVGAASGPEQPPVALSFA